MEAQCSQFLREGVTSPWNTVQSQQRYTSSIVYGEAAPPCITWSPDMAKITCQGFTVDMKQLRSGLSNLFDKVERAIHHLCGDTEIPIKISPELSENMTDDRVGYSYLELGGYTTQKYPLLEHLLSDTRKPIAKVGLDNTLEWQTTRLIQLRAEFDEINRDLAVLCYILPAPPPRGTEFTNIRIRNSQLSRNLFKNFGSWFIYQMVKTTNLTGKLSWVPALLPERLGKLLDRFLILIRPVESIFAQVLDDPNGCAVYQEYLWVQSGQQMTSGDFSQILSATTRDFIGCELGLHIYRHVAISVAREHIPPSFNGNNMSDILCNHGSGQAQKTYARETHQLPFLTTDVLMESREACSSWHDTLGFGSNKPPIPFRLLTYRFPGQTSIPHQPLPPPPVLPINFGHQLSNAVDTLKAHFQSQHQSLKTEIQQSVHTAVSTGIESYMAQSGLVNIIPQLQHLTALMQSRLIPSPPPLVQSSSHPPPAAHAAFFHPPPGIVKQPPPFAQPHSPFIATPPLNQNHSIQYNSPPLIPRHTLQAHNPPSLSTPCPQAHNQSMLISTPSPLQVHPPSVPHQSLKRPSPSSHEEDQVIMPPTQRSKHNTTPNSHSHINRPAIPSPLGASPVAQSSPEPDQVYETGMLFFLFTTSYYNILL